MFVIALNYYPVLEQLVLAIQKFVNFSHDNCVLKYKITRQIKLAFPRI